MTRPDTVGSGLGVRDASVRDALVAERLLVARVRAGDPLAFEVIFRRYHRELCTVAERIAGSRAAAEDVVQDVFLRVWSRRAHWCVGVSLRAYLRRATRNAAFRCGSRAVECRSESLADARTAEYGHDERRGTTLTDTGPSPQAEAEAAVLAEEVARATAALPPRAREVYRLSREVGLSTREIARRLELSPKTVEMHLTRALAALRHALAAWRNG